MLVAIVPGLACALSFRAAVGLSGLLALGCTLRLRGVTRRVGRQKRSPGTLGSLLRKLCNKCYVTALGGICTVYGRVHSFPRFSKEYKFCFVWLRVESGSFKPVQARRIPFPHGLLYPLPVVATGKDGAVIYIHT